MPGPLVPGWVTVCMEGKPSWYVTNHPSRLSLLPSMGWENKYQLSGSVVINGDGECSTTAARLSESAAEAKRPGSKVGGHPALVLYSSNEPGELWQWLCHGDNNINTVVIITIIIILWIPGGENKLHWGWRLHAEDLSLVLVVGRWSFLCRQAPHEQPPAQNSAPQSEPEPPESTPRQQHILTQHSDLFHAYLDLLPFFSVTVFF